MKISVEKLEQSQVAMTIEAEPEEMEKSLDAAYRRLVKRAAVPGFRPGKAPRPILESYLGREMLERDAVEHLIPELYERGLKEQSIEAIAEPQLEVTGTNPVAIKAVVPVRPTVELGDYHQIKVSPEAVEVKEEEVDKALEDLRQIRSPWEPVARPVQADDLVILDLVGHLDGKPLVSQKGFQYEVRPDSKYPVPGFAGELLGLEKGGEKEMRLSFPPEYEMTEFQGKEYLFRVNVVEVKARRPIPLDDEFARSEGLESLAALRQRVTDNLRARAEEAARNRLAEKAIEQLAEISRVEYPPILVEREIDRMLRGVNADVSSQGGDNLREQLHPLASQRVIRSLALARLTEAEKIEVKPEEVGAEAEHLAQGAGERAEELRRYFANPQALRSVEEMLLTRKTVDRLLALACQEGETRAEDKQNP